MRLWLYCVVALATWMVLVLGEEEEDVKFKTPEGKSLYGHMEYHKKGKKCYQCAWSPPKLAYATLKTSNYQSKVSGYGQPSHTSLYYSAKKVPVKVQGGWDKCYDTFNKHQAEKFGIDQWECEHNCYTRTDKNGNLYRGCYKGEYSVNPHKLGCHVQAGSQYCFCAGELCNHRQSPEYKGSTKSPAYSGKRSYKNDYDSYDYDVKHKGYGKHESYNRKGYDAYDKHSEYDKYGKNDKYDKYSDRYDKGHGYGKSERYDKDYGSDKKYRYDSYEKDDSDYGYGYSKKHSKRSHNKVHDKYDKYDKYDTDKYDKYDNDKYDKYDNDKYEHDKYDNDRYGRKGYDRHGSHKRGYGKRSPKYAYNKHESSRYGYRRHDSHEHGYDKHDSHKSKYDHDSHKYDYNKHDSHEHGYEKQGSHKHGYDKHSSHRQHYDKHDAHDYGSSKHGKPSYSKHDYRQPDPHHHDSHIAKYPWNTVNIGKHSDYDKPRKYEHKKHGLPRRSRSYSKRSEHDREYGYGHHKHSSKKPRHSVYPKHGYDKHRPQRYSHQYHGARGNH